MMRKVCEVILCQVCTWMSFFSEKDQLERNQDVFCVTIARRLPLWISNNEWYEGFFSSSFFFIQDSVAPALISGRRMVNTHGRGRAGAWKMTSVHERGISNRAKRQANCVQTKTHDHVQYLKKKKKICILFKYFRYFWFVFLSFLNWCDTVY